MVYFCSYNFKELQTNIYYFFDYYDTPYYSSPKYLEKENIPGGVLPKNNIKVYIRICGLTRETYT